MRIARDVALIRMTKAMRSSKGWEYTSLVRKRILHGAISMGALFVIGEG